MDLDSRMRDIEKRCRALTKALRCHVQVDSKVPLSIWVQGPSSVYGPYPQNTKRPDPFHGDHSTAGWDEVWDHLEAYRIDLALDEFRLSARKGEAIRVACGPLGSPLFEAWIQNEPHAAKVLADWLLDSGNEMLASVVRLTSR